MSDESTQEQAVSLLQELGLKEYEARCFVALTALPQGTAKEISEVTEVPRTRVYDAIRVLEAEGLVEVQHSSPRRFRGVSIEEATRTLEQQYEERLTALRSALAAVDLEERPDEEELLHEVWSLSGRGAIDSRVEELVAAAESEVVLVTARTAALSDSVTAAVREATARGVDVYLGLLDQDDAAAVEFDEVTLFSSGLEWLRGPSGEGEAAVSRLLLVDRAELLVSTTGVADQPAETERAVYASGLGNGIVVIARRLLETGLSREAFATADTD